jgi:hypothetical protein
MSVFLFSSAVQEGSVLFARAIKAIAANKTVKKNSLYFIGLFLKGDPIQHLSLTI